MPPPRPLAFATLALALVVGARASWTPAPIYSTRDLLAAMYPVVSHAPCVLLLNATGSVGCSTAGDCWAPLRRVDSLEDAAALDAPAALLLPASLFPALAAEYFRALSPERAEDPRSSWAPRVRGVLVEAGVEDEASACAGRPSSDEPAAASAAAAGTKRCANARSLAEMLSARAANDPRLLAASFSPGVADAADVAASSAPHAWNPNAFGAAAARFPRNVPVALLDDDGVAVARAFAGAADGAQTHYASKIRTSVRGVAFDLTMNAAASEREDSSAETSLTCLARRTCAPLGGHSAFASVPPRPDVVGDESSADSSGDESSSAASFVLVSARMDASSLFHDAAFGANAAMSGLVAVLAAAEAFAAATRRFDASRVEGGDSPVDATPALFAAFGGEAFGFAGSRRFARERERLESNDAGSEPSLLPDWLRGRALKAHVELGPVGFSAKTFGGSTSPSDSDEGSGASSATDSSAASDPPPLPPRLFAHANSAAGPAADALVRTLREASSAGRRDADASSGAATLPVVRATGAPRREADESSESSASADSSSLGAYFPPSSADALIRRDPKAPCAYLAEHDGAVLDPFAHGAFDAGRSRVDPSRVAGAAAVVARALARLAYDGGGPAGSDASDGTPTPSAAADAVASGIDDAAIRRSVDRLVDCLIDPAIGFECELAAQLGAPPTNFAASETFPSRYVGVASPRDVLAWRTDASREDDDGASDSDSDADAFGFSSPARRSGERRALDYASDVERFARAFLETVTAAAAPDLSGDPGTRANAPLSASSSKPCDSSDACDEGAGERCVRVGGLGEDPRAAEADERGADARSRSRSRARSRSLLGGAGSSDPSSADSSSEEDVSSSSAGRCVFSGAFFLPAISHRVGFDAPRRSWVVRDADADEAGLAGGGDPLWCESDWPGSVGARAYERESDAFELGVFVAGVAVTIAAMWLANRFEEAMKRAFKEE